MLDEGAGLVDVRDQDARRLPKDTAVVVMCASGMRSRGAAARLRAAGYRATSLSGGLVAWRAASGTVTR